MTQNPSNLSLPNPHPNLTLPPSTSKPFPLPPSTTQPNPTTNRDPRMYVADEMEIRGLGS